MAKEFLQKHFINEAKAAINHWSGAGGSGGSGESSSGSTIEVDILPKTKIAGFVEEPMLPGCMVAAMTAPFTLEVGSTYLVEWDGEVYKCTAIDASAFVSGMIAFGNGSAINFPGNNEPFAIVSIENMVSVVSYNSNLTEHDVRICKLSEVEGSVALQHQIISENGTYSPDDGYHGFTGVTVDVPAEEPILQDKTVTENGTYTADDGYDGLGQVVVDVAGSGSENDSVLFDDDWWIDDVVFWDIDGTMVHKVTVADAANLDSLPTPPEHDKLTFVGWNYTLEQIRTLKRPLDVGAMYTTTDGKTYLKLSITNASYLTVPIEFIQTVASGVTVDWGDGITSTSSTTVNSYTTLSHKYSSVGTYWVTITVAEGCNMTAGRGGSSYAFVGGSSSNYKPYLIDAYFGERIVLNSGCMNENYYLESVVFPAGITVIPDYCMLRSRTSAKNNGCTVIPNTVTTIGMQALQNALGSYYYYNVQVVSIPESVISIGSSALNYVLRPRRLIVPTSVTELGAYFGGDSYSLKKVFLPDGLKSIGTYFLQNNSTLREVTISTETTIDSYAFSGTSGLSKVIIKNGDSTTPIDLLAEEVVVQPNVHKTLSLFSNVARWRKVVITGNPTTYFIVPATCAEVIFTGEPAVSAVKNSKSYRLVYVPDAMVDACAAAMGGDYKQSVRPLSEYRGSLPKA